MKIHQQKKSDLTVREVIKALSITDSSKFVYILVTNGIPSLCITDNKGNGSELCDILVTEELQ